MYLVEWFHNYSPSPVIIDFGPVSIHWYGVMFSFAIIVAFLLSRKIWQKRKWLLEDFDSLVIWLLVGGILGARLLDVFWFEWWYFKDNLLDIFKIWQGGLAWHGGLIGGGLVLWWWLKKYNYYWLDILDCLAPGLALGQAIGRWGNYFNQELFGLPTKSPWGIFIDPANRPELYAGNNYFQPVFFYEFLALMLLFVGLWFLKEKKLTTGSLFVIYLLISGLLRWRMEFWRIDVQDVFLGWRAGIWLAIAVIVLGVGMGWYVYKSNKGKA